MCVRLLSDRLSAYIIAAATWRISVKFDNGVLFENLSRKFKLGSNQTKMSENLDGDLSTFFVTDYIQSL